MQLYRQVGDVQGEAACMTGLGHIALAGSNYNGARTLYEAALLLQRQVGDLRGEAGCILGLGNIALRNSDLDGARACYEPAAAQYRQVGDVRGEANCVHGLGDIMRVRSDHDGAQAPTSPGWRRKKWPDTCGCHRRLAATRRLWKISSGATNGAYLAIRSNWSRYSR